MRTRGPPPTSSPRKTRTHIAPTKTPPTRTNNYRGHSNHSANARRTPHHRARVTHPTALAANHTRRNARKHAGYCATLKPTQENTPTTKEKDTNHEHHQDQQDRRNLHPTRIQGRKPRHHDSAHRRIERAHRRTEGRLHEQRRRLRGSDRRHQPRRDQRPPRHRRLARRNRRR